MIPVAIIGAGGFAREVLDVFDAINTVTLRYDVRGFIVDTGYGEPGTLINDKPILGSMDWFADHTDVAAICGVGAPEIRRRLIARATEKGVKFVTAIHPNTIMTRWVTVGEGCVITAGSILTNQIRIGQHIHINLDCTIGHDAVLEDYVTLAPGVHISGNVVLGEGCYIGTGANVIEKQHIGAWSIVGAGTTVVNTVPPNTTVVGVPGKVIKTREEGWHLR